MNRLLERPAVSVTASLQQEKVVLVDVTSLIRAFSDSGALKSTGTYNEVRREPEVEGRDSLDLLHMLLGK